jgi:hypothetical protein
VVNKKDRERVEREYPRQSRVEFVEFAPDPPGQFDMTAGVIAIDLDPPRATDAPEGAIYVEFVCTSADVAERTARRWAARQDPPLDIYALRVINRGAVRVGERSPAGNGRP